FLLLKLVAWRTCDLPFGENWGSKRKGERSGRGITRPAQDRLQKTSSSKNPPGAEGWGKPVRALARARGGAPEQQISINISSREMGSLPARAETPHYRWLGERAGRPRVEPGPRQRIRPKHFFDCLVKARTVREARHMGGRFGTTLGRMHNLVS